MIWVVWVRKKMVGFVSEINDKIIYSRKNF